MTTYNNREIPHPTLRPNGTDYDSSVSFAAEPNAIRRSAQNDEIVVAIKFTLTSPTLLQLIESGLAEYHALTECVATRIRELHRSSEAAATLKLKASDYEGEVIIKPFIVTTSEIQKFKADEWAPAILELIAEGADIPNAAILGIAPETSFQADETTTQESYLEIAPSPTVPQGQYRIELSGERIVIQINPDDKQGLNQVRRNGSPEQYLFPSMYQRAIEEGIRQHCKEDHEGKKWAHHMARQLDDNGIDTSDQEILEANSLEFAQLLMRNPLNYILSVGNSNASEEE